MTLDQNIGFDIARIPVRSRQQAMDWSLVLVSQGIESTIQSPDEANPWVLLVESKNSEKAFKALRLYQQENRYWAWPQSLQSVDFRWGGIGWAAVMIAIYWISTLNPIIGNAGILDSAKVFSGQWWRIITAMTLHADLAHLAANLGIGISTFGFVLGKFGTGPGLLLATIAGACGNVLSLYLHKQPFLGLGASGMVTATFGLLAAQSITDVLPKASRKIFIGGAAGGFMIFLLFGLAPGTDFAAHLGGFVSGFILGTISLVFPEKIRQRESLNIFCLSAVMAMFALCWTLAILHR